MPPSFTLGFAGHNRQAVDGIKPGTLAPRALRLRDGKGKLWPALEQRLQPAPALKAGELVAETEMNAGAERDMPVRPALKVEPLGMRIGRGVHVGSRQHRHDALALFD